MTIDELCNLRCLLATDALKVTKETAAGSIDGEALSLVCGDCREEDTALGHLPELLQRQVWIDKR